MSRRPGRPRHREAFVDTGAWIALALSRDPLHKRAATIWAENTTAGTRFFTSVPVIIETFTFLSRAVSSDLALRWKSSLAAVRWLETLECSARDLDEAFGYFERRGFAHLSAVDATSFTLMKREGLRLAFAFDTHFGQAGFAYLS